MQIELIGCTSAGKSTLAAQIMDAAQAADIDLVLADQFALDTLGLGKVRKKSLRAVFVHIVAAWGCISQGWRRLRFIALSRTELRHTNISWARQWNQLRKVLKQLGRYDLIRRSRPNQKLVLVDEGTLHAAHNIFIHVDFEFDQARLQQFAEQVPLPDLVIYVRQSEDVLVERTIKRGHLRISDPTRQSVADFVHQAVLAFDQLAKHERIAPLVLEVQDGVVLSEPHRQPHISGIVDFLRDAIESRPLPTNQLNCAPAAAAV
jgi:hypothetical protein